MEKGHEAPMPVGRGRYWSRMLRPLYWWVLLVLVLFGIRTHQYLSNETRLFFRATLQKHDVTDEVMGTLGAEQFRNGSLVSIGWHTFSISNARIEPFTTNFFVWYGSNTLGVIPLERSMGLIRLSVNPPAQVLSITGPELNMQLTNCAGVTSSVPTGEYLIGAHYAHWNANEQVFVSRGLEVVRMVNPPLGAVDLECNQSEATFEVVSAAGGVREIGTFPVTITGLPAGNYSITTHYHRKQKTDNVQVRRSQTNHVVVEFAYGTLVIESVPAAAGVSLGDGTNLGETPVVLTDVEPGSLRLNLQLAGYEPVSESILVSAGATNVLRTNLTSRLYTLAMTEARNYLRSRKYQEAVEATKDALRSKPGDLAAGGLQRQIVGLASLEKAEAFAANENYIAAVTNLEFAVESMPEDTEARKLLPEYKKKAADQARAEALRDTAAKPQNRPK